MRWWLARLRLRTTARFVVSHLIAKVRRLYFESWHLESLHALISSMISSRSWLAILCV